MLGYRERDIKLRGYEVEMIDWQGMRRIGNGEEEVPVQTQLSAGLKFKPSDVSECEVDNFFIGE